MAAAVLAAESVAQEQVAPREHGHALRVALRGYVVLEHDDRGQRNAHAG